MTFTSSLTTLNKHLLINSSLADRSPGSWVAGPPCSSFGTARGGFGSSAQRTSAASTRDRTLCETQQNHVGVAAAGRCPRLPRTALPAQPPLHRLFPAVFPKPGGLSLRRDALFHFYRCGCAAGRTRGAQRTSPRQRDPGSVPPARWPRRGRGGGGAL